jgi:hypothetical protein
MRACPSCRRTWSDDHEVCPRCLASLVPAVDLDATITCGQCGHVCPARMSTCPSCFALLRASDIDATAALTESIERGIPLPRPVGRATFSGGVGCSVRRLGARSPLVVLGADGFVEASVVGDGIAARVPLRCVDGDHALFRLEAYAASDDGVVALSFDGAPLATFLRDGERLEVRDETSAPVARLVGDRLVETGGSALARVDRTDVETDGWIDDQWTLVPEHAAPLPLRGVAVPALLLAAKVLLGREHPDPVREDSDRFREAIAPGFVRTRQ